MSRAALSTGHDPFALSPRTPGPLGCNDAADPDAGFKLGDTPGSLGRNDCADHDVDSPYNLGIRKFHITVSYDKDLLLWDYDPGRLLQDDRLNPEFVEQAHRALKKAVSFGLRPKVHDAYRDPQESARKHENWKKGKGGKAAPAWQSVHNYGLAMDVWLYDRKNQYIDNHTKGWYKLYKVLAAACSALLWGEPFDDADHFEYHPKWLKPAKGKSLVKLRDWAIQAAVSNAKLVKYDALAPEAVRGGNQRQNDFIAESDVDWMPYFWWAAGARGGETPPDTYLASNRPPIQA
jgi:hypothetical protein